MFRKIMVVDDSKLMHKMYEVMLRQSHLIFARDGREGLDRLAEHPDIDLVLLDLNMPNMNGLEFLGELKDDPRRARFKVVIVTTQGQEEDTERGLAAGADAYITKPFRSEEINRILEQLEAAR